MKQSVSEIILDISSARSCIGYLVRPLEAAIQRKFLLHVCSSTSKFVFYLEQMIANTSIKYSIAHSRNDTADQVGVFCLYYRNLFPGKTLEHFSQLDKI